MSAAVNVSGGSALALNSGVSGGVAPEVLLEARARIGDEGFGLGLATRTRAGAQGFDVGAGPEICYFPKKMGKKTPYLPSSVCAGATLLTVGYRANAPSIGGMSPYLEPTFVFPMNSASSSGLFLSVPMGYDVRYTGPNAVYLGVTLGVGWAVSER